MSSEGTTKRPKRIYRRLLILFAFVIFLIILWQFLSDYFREEEKTVRRQFREVVRDSFPEEAAKIARSFGISHFEAPAGLPDKPRSSDRHVVLVHGLDDPGKVWMNLAPALQEKGHTVWIMRYPNDQPIVESSRLFAAELRALAERGITEVVIVAHSMGGLVSREMLTSPEIDYRGQMQSGRVQRVIGLIMVGTPNHGSEIARFRFMGEFRDQYVHFARGEGHWLRVILDGAGEAKIDLLPGSRFLTELNSRPHPEGVDMLVIAGVAVPWSDKDIDNLIHSLRTGEAESDQYKLEEFKATLLSMSHGLGDGLVTVDSALLPGIPHRTVQGTHLSIIRNVTESSDHIPPAIPIIIQELQGRHISRSG